MCGRYWIDDKETPQEMQAILDALNRRGTPAKTGEVFPADTAAVIANTKHMIPAPFAMHWGYALEGGRRIINARSETAQEKSLFADGMRARRCLIPASGYFEWARQSREKTKYEIADARSPMLYMAGLYRLTDAGAQFTILTRAPGEAIAFIHDRMPVILPRERLANWLDPACDAQEILAQAMTRMRFSPAAGQAQTLSFL